MPIGEGRMEKISLILAVINVLIIAGPTASMVAVHMDNPVEMVIPQEVQRLNEAMWSLSETLQSIRLISVTYVPETRTLILNFSVVNRLGTSLRINEIAADVVCVGHNYTLGRLHLSGPVELTPDRETYVVVNSRWTADAEQHIRSQHAGERFVDVNLVNFTVNVNGVIVQVGQPITIRGVPIGG